MNLDKAILQRKEQLFEKLHRDLNQVNNYKTVEDTLPSNEYLKSIYATVKIVWGDLRIMIPWNTTARLDLLDELDSEGWEVVSDNPRKADQTSWLTYLKQGNTSLELWMKADYQPEGAENLCQVVKLGTRTHSYEESIYDVVCPGDA